MGRLPRSASPSTGKRGSLHRLLVVAAAIVLLAAVPFAESVRKIGRVSEKCGQGYMERSESSEAV